MQNGTVLKKSDALYIDSKDINLGDEEKIEIISGHFKKIMHTLVFNL